MRILRTFVFSCVLLSSCDLSATAMERDTIQAQPRSTVLKPATKKEPFWAGCSVGYDLCGTVMALATPFGQYEGMFRLNIKDYIETSSQSIGTISTKTRNIPSIVYSRFTFMEP